MKTAEHRNGNQYRRPGYISLCMRACVVEFTAETSDFRVVLHGLFSVTAAP